MRFCLATLLFSLLFVNIAWAGIEQEIVDVALGRLVTIQREGQPDLVGELSNATDEKLIVQLPDGQLVSIARADVSGIKLDVGRDIDDLSDELEGPSGIGKTIVGYIMLGHGAALGAAGVTMGGIYAAGIANWVGPAGAGMIVGGVGLAVPGVLLAKTGKSERAAVSVGPMVHPDHRGVVVVARF